MIEMTIEKLLAIISSGESECVEFKTSFNDEALEVIGAFANTRGGTLFIGVSDTGEICGFQDGKKTIEDIANRIQEATDPRLQPSISVVSYDNKNIIVIVVSVGTGAPVSVRGRYFKRLGKTNQRMSHEEIMQRMTASAGLSWDTGVEPKATIEDLDPKLISQFIQTIKKTGRRPLPENVSEVECLRKMELIKDGVPTRAALLLLGNHPESFFSSAFIKMGRFRSLTHIVDDREIHGPLFGQLEGAMGWFRERLETEFIITGKLQRDVRWEYPLDAVREALINLICHRDYTSQAHSQVRLYDEHLVFRNAGGLPHSLTPEMLLHEHDSMPRNRQIADAFFYAGLIERWGSGTTRMAEELEAYGSTTPTFNSEMGGFQLTFYKPRAVEISEAVTKVADKGLSDRQIKAIDYVKEHGSITNSEYQAITGISRRSASRELNELTAKGILHAENIAGRGAKYTLKNGS